MRSKKIFLGFIYLLMIPLSFWGIIASIMGTGSPTNAIWLSNLNVLIWSLGPIVLLFSAVYLLVWPKISIKSRILNIFIEKLPLYYLGATLVINFGVLPILDTIF